MVKYKNLNDISDKLLEEIPKLKEGEEVVFEMLNGLPNHDPDFQARQRHPLLYGKTQIPTKSRIKDPHTGKVVDIGVPMAVENGEVKSFRPFLAGNYDGIFNGKFSLFGGKVEDEEFFQVFWLLNENESNPYRDKSVKPLFRIVNPKEEAKKSISKVEVLRNALDKLKVLNDNDFIDIAASLNWTGDIDAIKTKVNDFAKSQPDKFLTIADSPETKVKSNIRQAMDKNILDVDMVTGLVKLGDTELFQMTKEAKEDFLGAISKWINVAKNGKDVYDGIVKQLAAK